MLKRLPILLSLFLFAVILSTGLTASAAVRRTATVNVDTLNVRSGPTLQHSRISRLQRGNILPVLTERSGWLQVHLATGLSGWVAARHVSVRENSDLGRISGAKAIVNAGMLNVRSGAGTAFGRLATVSRGSLLQVLSRQGNWLQVKLPDGRNGWVAAQHTTIREGAQLSQAVPVMPVPAARIPDSSARGNILRAAGSSAPSSTVGAVTVNVPGLTVAPPSDPTERRVYVTVDGSTVWSGPGFEARQVSTLSRGTSLTVVDKQTDWLQVRLSGGELVWIASWLVTSGEPEPLTTATKNLAAERPAWGSPLSGRIVVLDPGHGIDPNRGWETGAVGVTGLVEDGLVLDVSLQAAELLRQAGAEVVLTRGDTTISLRQRVAIAEQAQAHVFVSVHANAYFSRNISGTETFYFRGRPNDTESRRLATCLQAEMLQAFGLPDRGVKHGNFHVIRETTMPAALIEFGFLSNPRDEALMRTPQFRSAAARAIFFGLERFFQL